MDMQKILEYRNARNRFCQRIGITVTELSPGYAKVVKTVTEDDLNPVDVAHGGLFFSMADNAAGSAMAAYGEQAVTLNAQYNFMRAAKAGDVLTAEARERPSTAAPSAYSTSGSQIRTEIWMAPAPSPSTT